MKHRRVWSSGISIRDPNFTCLTESAQNILIEGPGSCVPKTINGNINVLSKVRFVNLTSNMLTVQGGKTTTTTKKKDVSRI